ncbi:MAG: prepilin-type N-terminal cleavage/methylation domain-containing protein [Nitrospira sp.]|nr:prepilin-type N-terminal cleavage/methylation domain-containing protein [Nitrospira sp.]
MRKILVTRYSLLVTNMGFTLLEVLLAFTILSIILVALYTTFSLSQRAMSGIDESLLKLQESRMAIDAMRREIDSILYRPENKNSVFKLEDKDIYGKQASRLFFTAFSPLMPGLSLISYYVEEKDGKLILFKTMSSAYASNAEGKGVEVVEDAEAFMVEVLDGNKWVKTWDTSETKRPPEEIKITITVLLKGKRVSISETVNPKIDKTL